MNRNKAFFKKNKQEYDKTVKIPVTADYVDENGNIVEWEFKCIDSKLNNDILRSCLVHSDKGDYIDQIDYKIKFITASCIYPDLDDVELQESYGVSLGTHLLMQLVSNPYEFSPLYDRIVMELAGRKPVKKREVELYEPT